MLNIVVVVEFDVVVIVVVVVFIVVVYAIRFLSPLFGLTLLVLCRGCV